MVGQSLRQFVIIALFFALSVGLTAAHNTRIPHPHSDNLVEEGGDQSATLELVE